jgi:hypothetical protein
MSHVGVLFLFECGLEAAIRVRSGEVLEIRREGGCGSKLDMPTGDMQKICCPTAIWEQDD